MRLIITGGAGFIGSHLILLWNRMRPQDEILNLDMMTYASDRSFEEELSSSTLYHFKQLNLTDKAELMSTIEDFNPEGVIHLAAETHVDNSILDPEKFLESNIISTYNLIEALRRVWRTPISNGVQSKDNASSISYRRLHHVSTDEVFGALGDDGYFDESSAYSPRSPYAATKASCDHLIRAWGATFGLNYTISNCSNNFGPRQHAEKLIPTAIRGALESECIPVYGRGENVRDWVFVEDHCKAIMKIFLEAHAGKTYCVGGANEIRNLDLVFKICSILDDILPERSPSGGYGRLIRFVSDRPGHDFRYALRIEKIKRELFWEPTHSFDESLRSTVMWYLKRYFIA